MGKSITKVITVKVSNLSGDAQKALELIRAVSGMKLPEKGEDYSEAQIKQINEAYSAYAALETAERLAIEKDKAWKKFTKATDALGAFYHLDGKTGTDIRDSKKKFLPWYVRLVVSETSLTGRQQTKILKLLGEGSTVPAAYNIRLVNTLDNTAWKPDGIINVKMQIPNMADPDRLVIIHIGKSGRIELINGKVSDDRKQIAFDTAEFSVFALAVPENSVKSLLEPEEEEVNFLPWCFGGCGALALALLLLLLRRITDRA